MKKPMKASPKVLLILFLGNLLIKNLKYFTIVNKIIPINKAHNMLYLRGINNMVSSDVCPAGKDEGNMSPPKTYAKIPASE